MSQATKLGNTDRPALSLRNRLVLGSALATSAFVGGYRGYVRRAYANCSGAGGIYTCSNATGTTQTLTGTPLTVTTVNGGGFSIDTRPSSEGGGGNAFTLTGTGGLTFTDSNFSTIIGAATGVSAVNGGGALSITATGAVIGTSGTGIFARNGTYYGSEYGSDIPGTDLTIVAGSVNGASDGITAQNNGIGALSITTTGTVTGTSRYGIYASNSGGTDLTIEAADVSGGTSGIHAEHYGTGALSITATGMVTGTAGDGIYARTLSDVISSTDLTIEAANVSGGIYGISAEHHGTGALSITATGTVTGGTGAFTGGIYARNYGGDLTIAAGDVSGGLGIGADQEGTGVLSITAVGTVRGTYASGIFAFTGVNSTGLTINVADVSGDIGIFAEHHGSGALTITASGPVTGGIDSGGIFALTDDNATGLTIEAIDVSGGAYGIFAEHRASGALAITTTGTVTGTTDDGIHAVTYGGATDLTIEVADVRGGEAGIYARHSGTGALSITANGTVTGNGGSGIYARNDSAATGSATTVTVQDSATVSGSAVGVELVSGTGRAAGVDNAGSIAGATGILANTAGSATITNAGSITGTGGTAIDLTGAGASTINQQGGVITGNILLSASPDAVSVAGGTIAGNVVGGAGDDKVTVSGGAITGNVTGDDGDEIVAVSGGTIHGNVSGGAGFDQVSVSGGTIEGGIDADHVHLSGGTIDGNITGLGANTLIIDNVGAVDPLNLADRVLFSGTGANGTVTGTDLAAGGKSQNFAGFDNFSADASTLRFSGGTQGINQLNLGNGSTLFINGNVTMPGSIIATNSTLFINGNFTMSGSIIATNSLIDMTDGFADDVLTTLGGLTLNGARIGLDINQQTVQADQLVASAFSATGANTIIVNLLGTPQFAQATDIPLIVSTGGPIAGTFDVVGIPGTPGSLFTYQVVAGPNGGLFLRATPANFGIAAAPTSATNAGAVTVAIDALYGINRDALDADLNLSPATGGAMVPVSSSFGVFASGQFAHTEHDGYDISGGGLNGPGPSFDANDFSAAVSLDFNAAKHFQFDNEYGLNIGVFAGYASTDVNLGAFRGFDAIGEGTNKAGMFGGYVLFRKSVDYALVSASGFIGGSDVTNGVLGTTGSYDTKGYAVTGSVGHIFMLGERTRFDLRGGLLGVSFRGD
ncbi:hypothetical protein NKH57_26770, partial [Mesorhizobium sp. M1050]|uniref:beta strand repeat-containing protein n=1 Tax=Mesorhizobium sp. M1050 TaxID=2957051 RepID=UPI003338A20A